MGREAVAVARWRGEVAEVKALLESQEIILRGAIKARIARSGIAMVATQGDELSLHADGDMLVLELGASEAAKWREALLRPPPSLASKLGIGDHKRALVIGKSDDAELAEALAGATCLTVSSAALLLAIVTCKTDLITAVAIARQNPELRLWCVYPKGKDAAFGDTAIRSFMRDSGYVDSKSCAVSPSLTATRYGRKA